MAIGKKTKSPGFKAGDHWVVCDLCGMDIRSSQAKKTWDNLVVCPKDYETRHTQDFVKARHETIAAQGLVRPEPTEQFVTEVCTTRSSVAGIAQAGCMVAGWVADPSVPDGTFNTNTL